MKITATELKENLGLYLEKSEDVVIYITKNGWGGSMLCSPYKDKMKLAKSLIGILPEDVDLEKIREERIRDYENLG